MAMMAEYRSSMSLNTICWGWGVGATAEKATAFMPFLCDFLRDSSWKLCTTECGMRWPYFDLMQQGSSYIHLTLSCFVSIRRVLSLGDRMAVLQGSPLLGGLEINVVYI